MSGGVFSAKTLKNNESKFHIISPAENHFDLELRSKVFFLTDSGSADITFEESK